MSLKRYDRAFCIDSDDIEDSDFIKTVRKKIDTGLYDKIVEVMTTYIENQHEDYSGGYFKVAFIVGTSGKADEEDIAYIWAKLTDTYGADESATNVIKRILGTICMMCVARDDRDWLFIPDMEKTEKLLCGEKPEGVQYFLNRF